ncbi:MAG: ketopantoate reductase family protein [Humibacter sp.]
MRVLVIGAGAVGGYFGARLAQAGLDVTFLLRPERADQVREHGLVIRAVGGEQIRTSPAVVTTDGIDQPFDVILLAVKGTALDAAIADIAPTVGPSSVVLPVLNGIRHLDVLREWFGPERILGGVCLVATERGADGTITQIAPGATLVFGELDGSITDRARALVALFAPAEFDSALSETIEQDMWEKWFFMAAGGAATVLLGGVAGEITAVPNGRSLVQGIIEETSAVIEDRGYPIRPAALKRVSGALLSEGSPFTTSMYRDLVAGRSTEVEPILGDLIDRMQSRGVPVPLLEAATVRLRVHEAQLKAASGRQTGDAGQ